MNRAPPIGQFLVYEGVINLQQLRTGLSWQRRWGGKLGHALMVLGFVGERTLTGALSRQLGIPEVALEDREIPESVIRMVPARILRARRVLPVALLTQPRRGTLLLATAEPLDIAALDEVAFASGRVVRPLLAPGSDIDRALARHLDGWRFRAPVDLPPEASEDVELDFADAFTA
jgi:type IV pilus assembly protein PilB